MKILETNKKRSLMWRFAGTFIFTFAIVVTYWCNLNTSFNGHNNDELNTVQKELDRDSNFREDQRNEWNDAQNKLRSKIEDCENEDIAGDELVKCQEAMEKLVKAISKYEEEILNLDIEKTRLEAQYKNM